MAFTAWTASVDHHDIRSAIDAALRSAGFAIEDSGTTAMQLSALKRPELVGGSWSNVRLVAMWENKSQKRLRIELRSDEPMLRPTTHCTETARALQGLLPPA